MLRRSYSTFSHVARGSLDPTIAAIRSAQAAQQGISSGDARLRAELADREDALIRRSSEIQQKRYEREVIGNLLKDLQTRERETLQRAAEIASYRTGWATAHAAATSAAPVTNAAFAAAAAPAPAPAFEGATHTYAESIPLSLFGGAEPRTPEVRLAMESVQTAQAAVNAAVGELQADINAPYTPVDVKPASQQRELSELIGNLQELVVRLNKWTAKPSA